MSGTKLDADVLDNKLHKHPRAGHRRRAPLDRTTTIPDVKELVRATPTAAVQTHQAELRHEADRHQKKCDRLTAARDELKRQLDGMDEAEKELVKKNVASYATAIEKEQAAVARLKQQASKCDKQLDSIAEAEERLGKDLKAIGEDESTLEKVGNQKEFNAWYECVSSRLSEHKDKTYAQTNVFGDVVEYPWLTPEQILVLDKMLEFAQSLAKKGFLETATQKVIQTDQRLGEYVGVTLGALPKAARSDETGARFQITKDRGATTELISQIEGWVSTIIARAYPRYQALGGALSTELTRTTESLKSEEDVAPLKPLLENVKSVDGACGEIDKCFDAAEQAIESMEVNLFASEARDFSRKLNGLRMEAENSADSEAIAKLRDRVRTFVDQTELKARELAVQAANVTQEDLRVQHGLLQSKFGQLRSQFKSNRDGTVTVDTGKAKGKLAAATVSELEIRMLAAQQLLNSNSQETLRTAQKELEVIERFVTRIQEEPDFFDKISRQITKLEKRITELKKKYGEYEVPRRVKVESKLDELKGQYTSQHPDAIASDVADCDSEVASIEKYAPVYENAFTAFSTDATRLERRLQGLVPSINDALKRMLSFPKLTQRYEGQFARELASARETAEKRDWNSIKEAHLKLWGIETDVNIFSKLLERRKELNTQRETPDQRELIGLLHDARQADQARKGADLQRKEYQKMLSATNKNLEATLATYKKQRLDASELEALKGQMEELKTRTEKLDDAVSYTDACQKLEQFSEKVDFLKERAHALSEFKDIKDLTEKAKFVAPGLEGVKKHADGLEACILGIEDTVVDKPSKTQIRSFSHQIANSIPRAAATSLTKAIERLDPDTDQTQQLDAREDALQAVRTLNDYVRRDKGLMHLRSEPFSQDSSAPCEVPDYGELDEKLTRIELSLLTHFKPAKK